MKKVLMTIGAITVIKGIFEIGRIYGLIEAETILTKGYEEDRKNYRRKNNFKTSYREAGNRDDR